MGLRRGGVLLERAAALTVKLELPERSQLDERVLTAMTKAAEAVGAKPAKVEVPALPAGGGQ